MPSRDYAPLWVGTTARPSARKQAIAHLRNADADGLDPTDYPVPRSRPAPTPAALAEAELRLTESVLTYARHAQIGPRALLARQRRHLLRARSRLQPLDVLSKLAASKNAAEALDSYQPPQPAYKALRKKLAEVRGRKGDAARRRSRAGRCSSSSPTRRPSRPS